MQPNTINLTKLQKGPTFAKSDNEMANRKKKRRDQTIITELEELKRIPAISQGFNQQQQQQEKEQEKEQEIGHHDILADEIATAIATSLADAIAPDLDF